MRQRFEENPHHSFDNWIIMFQHSIRTYDWASRIDQSLRLDGYVSDPTVVGVGALLHDIGKTYDADEETLHRDHGKLGFVVAGEFLRKLSLKEVQLAKLEEILTESGESTERKIIQDADILAFYSDRQLQNAFREWALGRGEPEKLKGKLDNFEKLNYETSIDLGSVPYERLRAVWAKHLE